METMRKYKDCLSPVPLGSAPAIREFVTEFVDTAYIGKRLFAEVLIVRMVQFPIEAQWQMAHSAQTALKAVARPPELCPVGVTLADSVVVGWRVPALHISRSPCGYPSAGVHS